MNYQFGNIVIVDENLVGVIVKCWQRCDTKTNHYDIYVRSLNGIKGYEEKNIKHYIHHKELSEDDLEYYN